MSGVRTKITRHANKKKKNTAHIEEKNQNIEYILKQLL